MLFLCIKRSKWLNSIKTLFLVKVRFHVPTTIPFTTNVELKNPFAGIKIFFLLALDLSMHHDLCSRVSIHQNQTANYFWIYIILVCVFDIQYVLLSIISFLSCDLILSNPFLASVTKSPDHQTKSTNVAGPCPLK